MSQLNYLGSLALVCLLLSSSASAACTKFTQSGDYFSRTGARTQIISHGYVCDKPNSNYDGPQQNPQRCNPNTQCPTSTQNGTITAIGTNNLSLSHDSVLPIYELVPTQTTYKPLTFLYSYSDTAPIISSCLDVRNGTNASVSAGYWAFTAIELCIDGTLSGCTDGPVEDGTAINICAVSTYGNSYDDPGLNGAVTFVSSDAESVENLNSDPAATVSPVPREPAATSTSTPTNSASSPAMTSSGAADRNLANSGVAFAALGLWAVL